MSAQRFTLSYGGLGVMTPFAVKFFVHFSIPEADRGFSKSKDDAGSDASSCHSATADHLISLWLVWQEVFLLRLQCLGLTRMALNAIRPTALGKKKRPSSGTLLPAIAARS